jgi:hypothetical protein
MDGGRGSEGAGAVRALEDEGACGLLELWRVGGVRGAGASFCAALAGGTDSTVGVAAEAETEGAAAATDAVLGVSGGVGDAAGTVGTSGNAVGADAAMGAGSPADHMCRAVTTPTATVAMARAASDP